MRISLPQVHQVFQRTSVRLLEDQSITPVFNASHGSRCSAVRAYRLSSVPQGLRRLDSRLHLGSLFRDERSRVHREPRRSPPSGRHPGEVLPQGVLEAEPRSNVLAAGKTRNQRQLSQLNWLWHRFEREADVKPWSANYVWLMRINPISILISSRKWYSESRRAFIN